jgi:PEGA domain-containing protein
VASTPESAEIEIDGEFMGNTPSVLDLDPGEHTVTVRKPGYAPWERKMKLAGGDVKLNAELEQEATK